MGGLFGVKKEKGPWGSRTAYRPAAPLFPRAQLGQGQGTGAAVQRRSGPIRPRRRALSDPIEVSDLLQIFAADPIVDMVVGLHETRSLIKLSRSEVFFQDPQKDGIISQLLRS